jgi:hypothetical protein
MLRDEGDAVISLRRGHADRGLTGGELKRVRRVVYTNLVALIEMAESYLQATNTIGH